MPPSPGEAPLREWGSVTPEDLERVVVISPHLDDAVLGCGQFLTAHPGATVITVFAGEPDAYPDPMTRWDALAGFSPGDDVIAVRREEDRNALAEVGAEPRWLDFVEHQYLDRPEWVRPEGVVDALTAEIRALCPTAVLAPFGLANPDHVCTHDAAMLGRKRIPEPAWFCYEDHGYKHIPGMLAWRVSGLFRGELWPTPAAMPVEMSPQRKETALAHYRSQVRALEADWRLSDKLAAPTPEQFWRLAPPPEGWERLSRRGDARPPPP